MSQVWKSSDSVNFATISNAGETLIEKIMERWSRRKWWMLAIFSLVFFTSASLIMALPDMYRGSTTVLLGQDAIAGSFVTSGSNAQLDQRLHVIRQELLSREHLTALIERFNLYDGMRQKVPAEALLSRIRKDIHISQSTTSQISLSRGQAAPMEVRIGYQGWSAEQVADVTNAIAESYREKYEEIRFGQASRTTEFLREQLDEIESRMAMQEKEINEFRSKNLGQLPQQENMNMSALDRLNTDLRLNGERQVQLLSRRNEAQVSGFGTSVGASGESRLEILQRELLVMRARYNSSHPGMIRLQEEIRQLERESNRSEGFVDNTVVVSAAEELRRLREEESRLRTGIATLLQRLQLIPEIDQSLSQMTNAYNAIREEHLALQRRYQEARLAESLESQQTQQFQVLERALPPDFAAGPNRIRLLIMAFVLALGGAMSVVFVMENISQSFYSANDLRAYCSVPVLSSIRCIQTAGARFRRVLFGIVAVVLFVSSLVLLGTLAYSNGQSAKGLVWMLEGSHA